MYGSKGGVGMRWWPKTRFCLHIHWGLICGEERIEFVRHPRRKPSNSSDSEPTTVVATPVTKRNDMPERPTSVCELAEPEPLGDGTVRPQHVVIKITVAHVSADGGSEGRICPNASIEIDVDPGANDTQALGRRLMQHQQCAHGE